MESVIILIWQMREELKFYGQRALVQAAVDSNGKAVVEAWKDYENSFFPYLETKKKAMDQVALDSFKREANKVYTVKPVSNLFDSRMRRKLRNERNASVSKMHKRKGDGGKYR